MGWPLRPRPGARLRPEHARQKLRLWGHPVRMSCKNFLTTHQLDTHFWTEFLYTFSWQYGPSRRVCRKRADTVGEPKSTEMGVSHMPSLKAKKLGKLPQEKVLLEL
jgi:hypothetical protein